MARNTMDRSRTDMTWWAVAALAVLIALVAGILFLGDNVGEEPLTGEEELAEEQQEPLPGDPGDQQPQEPDAPVMDGPNQTNNETMNETENETNETANQTGL